MSPDNRQHITGLIIAGGQGSRLGYCEKGLLQVEGRPIIERLIETLTPLTDSILISANTRAYDYLGLPVLRDHSPGKGPIEGLHRLLTATETRHNLVVACDMPYIRTSFLKRLLQKAEGYEAVLPARDEQWEPLCAYYVKSCATIFRQHLANDQLSLQTACRDLQSYSFSIAPADRSNFWNLNTPDDYTTLKTTAYATA